MTDLDKIATDLEAILNREVSRIAKSEDSLTDKTALVVEKLSKLLDACIERRSKRAKVDPFTEISTEDLEAAFE